ncbi:twin-argninine leader-binding protein DmsD, partial [Bacillus sp. SRB_28]
LELREWMRQNGIARAAQNNDPEDSFGTLLLLAAWLCESGQDEAFSQLLARHLLPWSGRFLAVFVSEAGHPFYQALGQLSQATLAEWQDTLTLVVADKPLYR